MLTTSDFSAGSLSTAKPLSMLLPRVTHEQCALIAGPQSDPVAVALDSSGAFRHFKCLTNTSWEGLIVSGLRVEVDEGSVFNPAYEHAKPGSVIRRAGELVLRVASNTFEDRNFFVALESDLPALLDGAEVGFRRWQLVLGTGIEKRVLRVIDSNEG